MNPSDFKKIPSVDSILNWKETSRQISDYGHFLVKAAVDKSVNDVRELIRNGNTPENINQFLVETIQSELNFLTDCSLKKVINGTGIIVHTNLGRAVLSEDVMSHVSELCSHYCNLEYDLDKGKRGHRDNHAERLLSLFFNVESACVVNNNAAAVMLVLNTFAEGKEVVVSRGELVEIGGSFRIPEVMKKAGARLVEVGSTNKTHLSDYENAINEHTGLVLKVHPSNYRISGFTDSVPSIELSRLCKDRNVPFVEDMGSGNIYDLKPFGMNDEPMVSDCLNAGIDLVTFSGDKLFGGVQAGIIIGNRQMVHLIRKNHLLRALRVDKMVYAALEKQLLVYLKGKHPEIPINSMLFESYDNVKQRVNQFIEGLDSCASGNCRCVDSRSKIGGGTTPEHDFSSAALELSHPELSPNRIELLMRNCSVPVIGRIEKDHYLIDFRTVLNSDLKDLKLNVNKLYKK